MNLQGTVERIVEGGRYGFIRGDDGVQYFFIPSYLFPPEDHSIKRLKETARVRFEPFDHRGRMRARAIETV